MQWIINYLKVIGKLKAPFHWSEQADKAVSKLKLLFISTRLKNKVENNSTWEGAFYESKWVKINSS